MGRKGKWYGNVKKIFSSKSTEKKKLKSKRRKYWCCLRFSNSDRFDENSKRENEQNNQACSVVLASAVAAEAAAVAAEAAAQLARLTASSRFADSSREQIAAVKIQTVFRGYKARRRLQALRGLVRLKSLVEGNAVKRQTKNALYCMQTWARVQSQINSRRIRMTKENQALQRELQLKRKRELERSKLGEEWIDGTQSKEQIEGKLLKKQAASVRRERALAYAHSHQWKNSSRSVIPTFTDPHNPYWGWSGLERWMAARPWENNHASVNNAGARRDSILVRTPSTPQKAKCYACSQSPSTPPSKAARKLKSVSHLEDDSRSVESWHSEQQPGRHVIPGSSSINDKSLANSPAIPSYMAHTESVRAKSRFHSPSTMNESVETPKKGSMSSAKKRLSFPETDQHSVSSSPGPARRHSSSTPKVNVDSPRM